ncbi:MAG: orotate phosphoribosyltransferase [Christensenellales bacterium]
MAKERVLEIFREIGVLREGHFLLTSGRHSDRYMQCAKLFEYPKYSELLCGELARRFADCGVDIVVGPAVGGIIMSYEVSRALGVRNIFAERQDGKMAMRRGFTVEPNSRVLVVEDVITTGGSVKEVIELVRGMGAESVGVGVIVDRSDGKAELGYRTEAILSVNVESYEAADCPLCSRGIDLVQPGSRGMKR